MQIATHFIGWDRPFSIAFAERLRAEAAVGGAFDEWMIWVPSARAGRHVLNELFTGDGREVEAFHPPRLMTPASFGQTLPETVLCAGSARQLLAWKTVIWEARPADLQALFPVLPAQGRRQWAFAFAAQLMRMRMRLLEDRQDFRSIGASSLEMDQERWAALAQLELAYLAELQRAGLADPGSVFDSRLQAAVRNFPYRRVLVGGVLNLSRRQVSCLEALAGAGIRVDLYLPAPDSMSATLDAWGRPLTGTWDKAPIPAGLLEGRLQRAGEPRELVDRFLGLADIYHADIDALVVGAPDTDIARYVVERSRLTRTPCYTPEGKPLTATSWGRLIRLVAQTRNGAQFRDLLELLRHSLFRKWLRGNGCVPEAVERALLALMQERLIHSMEQLLDPALRPLAEAGVVRDFLRVAAPVIGEAERGEPFPERIWRILQGVAAGLELSDEAAAVLEQLEEILQDLQAEFDPRTVAEDDYWEILFHLMQTSHHYPEREAEERPVSGWLELPWERAPHLVVLGLPDSVVPGNDGRDAFLTPSLCRQLGLYGPDEAAAFHAFRLRLILESRQAWGKLDILLPDRGLNDDPEQAARFLFLADETDIPGRVEMLLNERPAAETAIPASFGARLSLPPPPVLTRIRVTDFTAYLGSPFHYFIERALGWSPPRELPLELDALAFGTLAHRVLEQLNSTEEGARLTGEKDIAAFLDEQADQVVRMECGSRPGVPVLIQASALRERLRAAAAVIAGERQAGWRPFRAEWKFSDEVGFMVDGVRVTGKIDLVELNAESGLYRVVDYKTSDSPSEAEQAHLFSPNANSAAPLFPECDFMDADGKTRRWKDLQLVLYHAAVEKAVGDRPELAYLNLAKAVKQVGLSRWSPTQLQVEKGLTCAEAVVRRIRQGLFPAVAKPRHRDDWPVWFGGDYTSWIDPGWKSRHMEGGS